MIDDFLRRHSDKIVEIAESGCWIWTGAATKRGYGIVFCGKRSQAGHKVPDGAHRASYAAAFGPIPEGKHVLHRCDVPSCVNPAHLFIGTAQDNMDDKVRKGRSPRGERHGRATLTDDQVRRIRRLYRTTGATIESLADRFNSNRGTIGAAVRGATFKYLEDSP